MGADLEGGCALDIPCLVDVVNDKTNRFIMDGIQRATL